MTTGRCVALAASTTVAFFALHVAESFHLQGIAPPPLTNPHPPFGGQQSTLALFAKKTKTAFGGNSATGKSGSREGRSSNASTLEDWSRSVGIQAGGVAVSGGESVADGGSAGGLGLIANRDLKGGDVVLQVPSDLALAVAGGGGGVEKEVAPLLGGDNSRKSKRAYRDSPWWARMSLRLNALDKVEAKLGREGKDAKAWFNSLPMTFDTPIHWSEAALEELQYRHLNNAVSSQKKRWRDTYDMISPSGVSFDDFVWGCETARSRCFSGPYSGTGAFDPKPYALTLVLVAGYVGMGVGTIEQAANGAGLVLCGTILKDFVLPKFLGSRKYVLCPYIDMANHVGTGGAQGDVAFEYFSDGYSLALSQGRSVKSGEEVFISVSWLRQYCLFCGFPSIDVCRIISMG